MSRRKPDDLLRPLKLPPGAVYYRGETWVPPPVELPADPGEAVPGLIRFAVQVWEEIVAVFCGPAELAQRGRIPAREHALIGDWVRHLEMLVRRTIVIAALALKLTPAHPDPRPWEPGRPRQALLHDPASWRAGFRMLPLRGGQAHAPKDANREPAADRPSAGMAMRIEALRRVLSCPHGYALRFARTLARLKENATRSNAPRVYRLKSWDFHPLRRTTGRHAVSDGMALAQPLAERVWRVFWEPG